MKYVFDLDGTICSQEKMGTYQDAKPNKEMIEKINELHKQGHEIVIYTARGMNTYDEDVEEIGIFLGDMTYGWLNDNGVQFDRLIFGKPAGDFYVDDKAVYTDDLFVPSTIDDVYHDIDRTRGRFLNLGCGNEILPGCMNVDFRRTHPSVLQVDLSRFPWPFPDDKFELVIMRDFLEHFEYSKTEKVLGEAYRILEEDGQVEIQVPDFEICARAALLDCNGFTCNDCDGKVNPIVKCCTGCGKSWNDIRGAAIKRLYGGQDYKGNYHYFAFTKSSLSSLLAKCGFDVVKFLEEDHQRRNWNFKVLARKV